MRFLLVFSAIGLAVLTGCQGQIWGPRQVPPGFALDPKSKLPDGGTGGTGPTRLDCSAGPYATSSSLRRLSQAQYRNAIRDVFDGKVAPSPSYPLALGHSVTGFSTEADLNEFADQDPTNVMQAAEEVALEIPDRLGDLAPCAGTTPDAACLDTFIDKYARRAYRHPVSDDERTTLHTIQSQAVTSGATFTESVALMTAAMLQMPQFLYAAEDAAPTTRPLTGLEMASRLSFLFWDSIPDDALLDAAAAGSLDTAEGVATQAQRLLGDSRADASIIRFFREWTGTQQVSSADKSATQYPFFNNAFAASMNESFDRFVVAALRQGSDLKTLMSTPNVQVDANMATFFGVDPPASGWKEAALDPTHQSGIMTQPALLASLAHTTTSSYVLRGKFIRKQLLCQPLGTPPADAQAKFNALTLPPNPTGREASEAVRANPTCGSCHDYIDPGGLAFEHFDALGKWRDTYTTGRAIDPADTLKGVGNKSVDYSDHVQLMAKLADNPITQQCFAQQVLQFAMSRAKNSADGCTLQGLNDDFGTSGHVLETPFLSVATSDAFRYLKDAE